MLPNDFLRSLGGFDERFFYHFEETDLCCRVWEAGRPIRFCPDAVITHLGGQSVGRFPIRFALETYRGRYRYFYKHFGEKGLRRIRWVSLIHLGLRRYIYAVVNLLKPSEALTNRQKCDNVLLSWNWRLDPLRFIKDGTEPETGFEPLTPPPVMIQQARA
jgi:GT2 family glycosyltransferase